MFVLKQEINHNPHLQTAVKLVQSVHADLSCLSRIIKGTTLLTTRAHKMAASLLLHELPDAWSSVWEGKDFKIFTFFSWP